MNSAGHHPNRSRVRRREGEGRQTEEADSLSAVAHTSDAPSGDSQGDSAAADGRLQSSTHCCGVQPLAEQMRKRPRLSCLLDSLAVVELQLVVQWLDAKSKLQAARCCRRLLHAASQPFAWKGAPPFVVEALRPAAVERIAPSLLRFSPIDLRCFFMRSFDCIRTVPHLRGLELLCCHEAAANSLAQLLPHPCMTRLQSLRLDKTTSRTLLMVATMKLIAQLPQLRTLDLCLRMPHSQAKLLEPLAAAPALSELSLTWPLWSAADMALLSSLTRMAGLRRLGLRGLAQWSPGAFRSFFCSPNVRRLQHLELDFFYVTASATAEHAIAFSALRQLQTLTLDRVFGLNVLLPHLRHAPALRRLSIRCRPDMEGPHHGVTLLPSRPALEELRAAAPRLEVRLLLPSSVERWLDSDPFVSAATRAALQEQWHQLHALDRLSIVYDQST